MDGQERPPAPRGGLRFAPKSPCGQCGRTTKTVQGVCADCWAPKESGAFSPRRRYRGPTETFWDLFFEDDQLLPLPGLTLLTFVLLIAGAIYVLLGGSLP